MKKITTWIILLQITLLCFIISCTKLDTKVYNQVTYIGQTPQQIDASIGSVYYGLSFYAPVNDVYNLNEVSTDEIIVPDRLTNWNDQVQWREMWKHTWAPNNPIISNGWQFIYAGIASINSTLQIIEKADPSPTNSAAMISGMKTVRAFYYYLALDLFGNVPIVEINNTDLSSLANKPRHEVFNYIEKELKEVLPDLPWEVNTGTYGRATTWFAQAILAKLYLNAEIYTGTARWDDCIAACDAILLSGLYSLEANFFDNFKIANEGSKENIFVLPFDVNAGLNQFWLQAATLHYNSNETFGFQFWPGGYNGFCSTAEYYKLFSPNDIRRKMFLVGQQYVNQIIDPANLQYDFAGHPLSFDPVITTFVIQDPKTETAGVRCAKWEFNKVGDGNMSNDFAIYRLADIILMKAEAQFRKGNAGDALMTINQKINGVSIRSRTGLPDFAANEMNADSLLAERARELSWEGHRRNDLIRFGRYNDARIPEKALSENFRILYPIPESELSKNPYLKQNPGY
jgi:starch-binding outer membrane protein, SusD/RagB family